MFNLLSEYWLGALLLFGVGIVLGWMIWEMLHPVYSCGYCGEMLCQGVSVCPHCGRPVGNSTITED
ncbi:MAG: hypothetical protein RB292_01675 [Patescibacteria group bacterium]|jgi:hypothetical protein|nr:hypothetical protein [Patescibacteria group bacterium]